MNLQLKLMFFREHRNWKMEDVAKKLGIAIQDYKKFETGKSKINGILAEKLSELYQAPIEFFIIDDTPYYMQAEVVYTHCSFNGNGSNGYINHQYNDRGIDEILFIKKEEIKHLKLQIGQLQQQNDRLIDLLGEQKQGSFS